MADTKISALTALTGALSASDDEIVIVDTSAGETKRMTRAELVLAIEANLFTGPVVIGAAAGSAGANDLVVDGGIFLGGTTTANELTDYEEGTWTPALSDGTNSDAVYTIQSGNYTKVGNVVTANCRIQTTSLGTISGNLQIDGLPFTSVNDSNNVGGGPALWGDTLSGASGIPFTGVVWGNSSSIQLYRMDASAGATNMLDTEWTATGQMIFGIKYYAA